VPERFLDADARRRDGLVEGRVGPVEGLVEFLDRHGVVQVALVVLQHDRDLGGVHAVRREVVLEVLEGVQVGVEHLPLAVRHEHDAVRALEHEPAGLVVKDLAGHGVELDLRLHPLDLAQIHGEEVEEERPVSLGGEGEHLVALHALGEVVVHVLQVRGLPAQPRSVVDHLGRELALRVVEDDHLLSPVRGAAGGTARRARPKRSSPQNIGLLGSSRQNARDDLRPSAAPPES
jgi:hypothetical protein